jgi:hypothetical protein
MLKQFATVVVSLAMIMPVHGQASTPTIALPTSAKTLPDAPQPQSLAGNPNGSVGQPGSEVVVEGFPTDPTSLDGLHAKLSLINQISSKLPSGSKFQARLKNPVIRNGQTLLPEGTVFEGHVQTGHAHRIMRPGSVFMIFDRVLLPGGLVEPINSNLLSTDSNAVKSDSEGVLHPALSKKRLMIQLGGTALAAKFADDLAQVIGGTAVGAGTARYVGLGAAATFFLIQKGREVSLRPGDLIDVEFGRTGPRLPISLPGDGMRLP